MTLVADASESPTASAPEPSEPRAPRTAPARSLPWIAALLIAASCMMVLFSLQRTSRGNANTGSRYATVESLVDFGTFSIERSRYRFTVDKIKLDGKFYSSKPPLLPAYAAGAYWVYRELTGQSFQYHESDIVLWCGLWTGFLFHLLTVIYFYRWARLLFRRDVAVLGSLAAVCFSYLGAGYATTLNNHSVAAGLVLVGSYYAYRARIETPSKWRHWILAGVCFGFLPGVDLPSVALSAAAGVYLLTKNWKRTLLLFGIAALPGLTCHFALTYAATGSLLPIYLRRELYQYPGSYWTRAYGIDALREPKYLYAFNMLLGHHGLFSMTPLFLFSLIGMGRSLRRSAPFFPEALVAASTTLVLIVWYVFRSRNYGGWCIGMRWLIVIMPLLFVFFGAWLETARLSVYKWIVVVAAFTVGTYNTQDALSGPFQFSRWHNWVENAPGRNRAREAREQDRPPKKVRKAKPQGR